MKKIQLLLIIFLVSYNITSASDNLIPILEDGRIGYINSIGDKIIPTDLTTKITYKSIKYRDKTLLIPDFNSKFYFSENLLISSERDYFFFIPFGYKTLVIDKQNEISFKTLRIYGDDDYHDKLKFMMFGALGFFASKNNATIVQEESFDDDNDSYTVEIIGEIESYHNGLASFEVHSHHHHHGENVAHSYINIKGQQAFNNEYDAAYSFNNGIALVLKNDSFFYIDTLGNKLFNRNFNYSASFSEGFAAVSDDGKMYGFIDRMGKLAIPQKFQRVFPFKNKRARIYHNGTFSYINRDGFYINKMKYFYAENFSDNLALIAIDMKYGYINQAGETVIQPEYLKATSFTEGLAGVLINEKWGFINKKNEVIIKAKYDYVEPFKNGLALVIKSGMLIYINKKGREIYYFDNL